jgi:hypothetical protein
MASDDDARAVLRGLSMYGADEDTDIAVLLRFAARAKAAALREAADEVDKRALDAEESVHDARLGGRAVDVAINRGVARGMRSVGYDLRALAAKLEEPT